MTALGLAVGVQGISQVAAGVGANRQASRNARILEKLGVIAAADERRATRAIEGAEVTAAAHRGGDPTTGSNLDIAAETAVAGELAARRAQFGFDAQAAAQRQAGINALVAGIVGGTGSILGGSARALGQNPSTGGGGGANITVPATTTFPGANVA